MRQIKQLYTKQMTRKEFLQFMGIALLTLFGIGNFISFLSQTNGRPSDTDQFAQLSARHGFGSRKFGE